MAQCYLLGIGGSGNKTVESFIHLGTAGLCPERVWLGFVDQDSTNGNVARAKRLLQQTSRLRSRLRQQGGKHDLGAGCPWLSTAYSHAAAGPVWSPVPPAARNMRELFSREGAMDNGLRDLFDAIYRENDEQKVNFDVGFRGRPSVGAAAILASTADQEEAFWRSLFGAISGAGTGEKVRIFLVGSLFGGTGAAGFPTIARLLRQRIAEQGTDPRAVEIGGALLLPYFVFPGHGESESDAAEGQDAEQLAHSELFLQQTRGALRYYHGLLGQPMDGGRHVLDTLYLLGWRPLIRMPRFKEGGPEQVNPPLMPEMLAALGAARFFRQGARREEQVLTLARGRSDHFGWDDMPVIQDGRTSEPLGRIGQLLRFCFAWHHVYRPVLTKNPDKVVRRQAWYQRLVAAAEGVALSTDEDQALLSEIDDFAQQALRWAATLEYRNGLKGGAGLVRAHDLAANQLEPADGLVRLQDQFDRRNFHELITKGNWLGLPGLYKHLLEAAPAADARGFGQLLGPLYDGCKPVEDLAQNRKRGRKVA